MSVLPWLRLTVTGGVALPQPSVSETAPLTLYVDNDPLMVYWADPTELVAYPLAWAIALIVSLEVTVIAPEEPL
jgi:hypothetical protein